MQRLGPYQLLAKIGEGGNSTVHLGKMDGPAGFSKLAAVKELHPDLNASSQMRALFLNEMRLAARLAHPNVVHAYGANEDAGRLYLAMEYLDGQPWSRIRRVLRARGALPSDLHLKVLAEVLAGLHYAHELREYDGSPLQVVHCDVSPQNVFVTYEGLVKVVDFGVARAVFRGDTSSRELIAGKLSYIAPEQLRGAEFDRRADLFAVGVMLWEAVTGRRFAQTKDGDETRRRRESGIEPRVRAVAPDAPAALVEICDRALALDPADRFATAAEFREALLGYLEEDMRDVDRLRLDLLVSDAFKDERIQMHRILDRYLRQPSSVTSSIERLIPQPAAAPVECEQAAVATQPLSPQRQTAVPSSAVAAWFSAKLGPRAVHDAREILRGVVRRWKLVLSLVGTACLVLGLSIASIASGPESGAHASPDHASNAPLPMRQNNLTVSRAALLSAPTPAANVAASATDNDGRVPGTIRLTIAAFPKPARLYLDGVPLAENPYTARVRADQQVHILRAELGELRSQTRVITFNHDQSVSFELEAGSNARSSARTRTMEALERGEPLKAQRASRNVDSPRARKLKKPDDLYDRELTKRNGSRPIYEDDPYR